MLLFTPIDLYKPGDLSAIIKKGYSNLVEADPEHWKAEEEKWDNFDKQAFAVPAIGKCLFVSTLEGKVVGLASWDPRNFPEYGIVGQNVILPEFRGKGYGGQQLKEVLRIFQANGAKKAKVTTSEHPFFEPAQGMYKSLGFKGVKRFSGGPDARYKMIELEKYL